MTTLGPDLLLHAYSIGVFPMAEGRDDPDVFFVEPEQRGILPLDRFHIPRSLRKLLRKRPFDIRCDTAFEAVLDGCAEATPDRPETWINGEIRRLYLALAKRGHCHSIEAWSDDALVGGLYGVSLGGAFFGESMFSRTANASKAALVNLVARLRCSGFTLLDCQFMTGHLEQFGAIEIDRATYRERLERALRQSARFYCEPDDGDLVEALLQSVTQTS